MFLLIIISNHCSDHFTNAALISNLRLCTLFTHSQKGGHPLYFASSKGRLECVELLLNHNAQIDLPANVSYYCNVYCQCSVAMHMTASLMYVYH